MAIEFAQITKAGSSGSSSDNSILEWEQPVNTYIGMSMGSLSEATETLTEEMATKFKTNKYNIIVSTVDLGANTITVNCYLEVINKINDSEDIILQYSGNNSSDKEKVYFTIDTANLQVKYYLEQGGSSGGSSGSGVTKTTFITNITSVSDTQNNKINYFVDNRDCLNFIMNNYNNIINVNMVLKINVPIDETTSTPLDYAMNGVIQYAPDLNVVALYGNMIVQIRSDVNTGTDITAYVVNINNELEDIYIETTHAENVAILQSLQSIEITFLTA